MVWVSMTTWPLIGTRQFLQTAEEITQVPIGLKIWVYMSHYKHQCGKGPFPFISDFIVGIHVAIVPHIALLNFMNWNYYNVKFSPAH